MNTFSAQLMLGAAMLLPASVFGQYTEGVINFPGAVDGQAAAYGIDANDQIAGYYTDNVGIHGFVLSQGVLARIDQPNALTTVLRGIDATKGIVGYEINSTTILGINDAGRKYKVVAGTNRRYITGINASGTFVGYDSSQNAYINSGGVYTTVLPAPCAAVPAPRRVYLNGINVHNDYVGYCYGNDNSLHGFAHVGGVDREVKVFGGDTYPMGINDSGTIAGYFYSGGLAHGFVSTSTTDTQFDFHGPSTYTQTDIYGINNKGSLVGVAYDSATNSYVPYYALAN